MLDGRYRLEEVVGHGGMGVTHRATRLVDGAVVAVKTLHYRRAESLKAIELFEREARVLAELDHPGIPKLIELITSEDATQGTTLHLVQSFVDGVTLEAEMKEHRHTEAEVVALLRDVVPILAYLHQRRPPVIHRDLKPSNLIRRPDGGVTLVDFGAVRDVLKDEIGGSTVAGTFGFMAPEQFAGVATPATDLYALGVIALVMLHRVAPEKLYDEQRRLRWEGRQPLHPATVALLRRLVESDPKRRAADAAELGPQIERVLALVKGENPWAPGVKSAPPLPAASARSLVEIAQREAAQVEARARSLRRTGALLMAGVLAFGVYMSLPSIRRLFAPRGVAATVERPYRRLTPEPRELGALAQRSFDAARGEEPGPALEVSRVEPILASAAAELGACLSRSSRTARGYGLVLPVQAVRATDERGEAWVGAVTGAMAYDPERSSALGDVTACLEANLEHLYLPPPPARSIWLVRSYWRQVDDELQPGQVTVKPLTTTVTLRSVGPAIEPAGAKTALAATEPWWSKCLGERPPAAVDLDTRTHLRLWLDTDGRVARIEHPGDAKRGVRSCAADLPLRVPLVREASSEERWVEIEVLLRS